MSVAQVVEIDPSDEIHSDQDIAGIVDADSEVIGTLETTIVEATGSAVESALFGGSPKEEPLTDFGTAAVTTLSGADLRRKRGATLGETLANEAGITASSYSPGVSRPIIRGLEGFRVRTLRDGLGTMDLSADSPDHGVLIDPLIAEAIDIFRGPSSLLYGNSAIGGAINTRTRIIPGPDGEDLAFTVLSGYETQGNARYLSAAGELRQDWVALGFSLSERRAGDISIPGRARTQAYDDLVQPALFIPGVGTQPLENPDGTLPNSFHNLSNRSLGIRLGYDTGWWFGFSQQRYETDYGIPFVFVGDITDLTGDSSINAQLDRTDFEIGWKADGDSIVREVRTRFGIGDYDHDELFRGSGVNTGRDFVETAFERDSRELRVDVFHESGDFKGVFGLHGTDDSLGVERNIVPPPEPFFEGSRLDSQTLGFFALQKWSSGGLRAQVGARLDYSDVSLTDDFGSELGETESSFSQSLAVGYEWTDLSWIDRLDLEFTLSRIERLPTAIERFAFYNNAALGRFLIGGDLDGTSLQTEQSLGYEFAVSGERGDTSAKLNFFYYDFENFVFLQDQFGINIQPTAQYVETPATFYGIEFQADTLLYDDNGELSLSVFADLIRATNEGAGQPLPRIPSARLGSGLTWERDNWSASLDARYHFRHSRVERTPLAEFPSDDYLIVDASVSWKPLPDETELELTLKLKNLLNQEARDATSFRKDTLPLAGFGAAIEARWSF